VDKHGERFARRLNPCCWKNKIARTENLLAMVINSDTNKGGASRGSISRNCENIRNPSVYADFERLFRPALLGRGLSFQWVSVACAGLA
jgi:hypothetical protein